VSSKDGNRLPASSARGGAGYGDARLFGCIIDMMPAQDLSSSTRSSFPSLLSGLCILKEFLNLDQLEVFTRSMHSQLLIEYQILLKPSHTDMWGTELRIDLSASKLPSHDQGACPRGLVGCQRSHRARFSCNEEVYQSNPPGRRPTRAETVVFESWKLESYNLLEQYDCEYILPLLYFKPLIFEETTY